MHDYGGKHNELAREVCFGLMIVSYSLQIAPVKFSYVTKHHLRWTKHA